MFHKKAIALLLVGVFTCISVFGQDVATVKKFERARKTVPVAISLNFFGFGIGSFMQGDTKSALIQVGISTVAYALIFTGAFGFNKEVSEGFGYWGDGRDGYYERFREEPDWDIKGPLIGVGSLLFAANAVFGAWRAATYQFDSQFDDFYNINNESSWPAAGCN